MQRLGGLLLPLIGSAGAAGPAVARSKASEAEEVLRKAEWPAQFPFSAEDFKRYDETPDTVFYSMPRFVTIAIANGKFYTLTTGANERRWSKVDEKLRTVVASFVTLYT
ncbi:unnamed protein product [Closterium sp. Naga37s-1]|nr:unnamed protein product [Closterium sp. Naga37s-1]